MKPDLATQINHGQQCSTLKHIVVWSGATTHNCMIQARQQSNGWLDNAVRNSNAAWPVAAVRAQPLNSDATPLVSFVRTANELNVTNHSFLPSMWQPTACQAGCGSSSHANASRTAALPLLIGDTACAGRTMSNSSAKMPSSHLRDSCQAHKNSGMNHTLERERDHADIAT